VPNILEAGKAGKQSKLSYGAKRGKGSLARATHSFLPSRPANMAVVSRSMIGSMRRLERDRLKKCVTTNENVGGALCAAIFFSDQTFREVAAGTAPPTFSKGISEEDNR
jgi:hypothetical protein